MSRHFKNFGAPRLLIVGFGDVAARVARQLHLNAPHAWTIGALVRSDASRHRARSLQALAFEGDLARASTLQRACSWAQAVVHLAPPPNHGSRDPHTQHLLQALGRLPNAPARRVVYVSTTGVYGDAQGDWVSENRPTRPQTPRATRRCDAEAQLREAAARGLIHLSILRAPGIYAADRLPLERLRAGTPALLAEQDMWTNHIHADDLASMIICALRSPYNSRVYNAVDFSQMKMGDYFDLVAQAYDLPAPPRLARAALAQVVSPMMLSFMSESRRMLPTRLVQEWHYRHQYPTVFTALPTRT